MKKKFIWKREKLDEYSYRIQVIGGWIVINEVISQKGICGTSSVFVPDRDHEWMIISKVDETKSEVKEEFQP